MTWALIFFGAASAWAFSVSNPSAAGARRKVKMFGHEVVLYTGVEDMRVCDNDGLWAASKADSWTPVLLVPNSPKGAKGRVLRAAAMELDAELTERYGAKLVVSNDLGALREKCDKVHAIEGTAGGDFHAWSCDLRPAYEGSELFSEYCEWASKNERNEPRDAPPAMPRYVEESSDWDLLSNSDDATSEPYVDVAVSLCGCKSAPAGVDDYVKMGRDAFADSKFRDREGTSSLYSAAAKWIAGDEPGQRMAAREPAERAFAAALAVGGLSKRQLAAKAKDTFPPSKLGTVLRSSAGCLLDVVEWREWYDILKKKRSQDSWWPWASASYPVRYIQYKKGSSKKALVLIHGFGASADQWKRLADELSLGEDVSIYAVDYVGFGYSAKPGFTYTQHLWEQMLEDFVREVVVEDGHETCVLAGNSIGGGLAAGLAANLGSLCSGLILLNTAGNILEEGDVVEAAAVDEHVLDVKQKTLNVLDKNAKEEDVLAPFSPPPGKQVLLDAFGQLVIELLSPRIPSLLKRYFPVNPDNADEEQAYEIARAAADPGAAIVIASGAKLPPQRTLNEVLCGSGSKSGFQGPILVPQGELDYVSGPDRARIRANQLANLREGVTVKLLESGHCPHDETPALVAREIESWWQDSNL